ncbi:MAG: hypothetical protein JSW05_05045 [Candidatus Thorarchaeota archaeon]|nr:MAG: hypothetical protein JSW05_05045 [Candidatus Thorarchaeota archaeon]
MRLEKVKREFIGYMEEVHGVNPYPRNFFGCLMAIIVEMEPVSQERIVELTGYSQGTVSLAIQKLRMLFPIRIVKRKGDRRNYYVYDDAPNSFILDLLQRRVDVQDIDIKLVDTVLEEVRNKIGEDESSIRFQNYLSNMRLYLSLIHELRSNSVEPFHRALAEGSLESVDIEDAAVLKSGGIADFILNLREATSRTALEVPVGDTPRGLLLLKNEYFTGIKTNLNPLFSQAIADQLIVVHSVLLEGLATQDRIKEATLLPRSTISDALAHAVERGIIEVSGSRPKYYRPAISFSDLMLASFDRVASYIVSVKTKLSEFVAATREVRPKTKTVTEFARFLKELENAYSLAHAFSVNMKVQAVRKLKAEYEQGFAFI